MTSRERLQAALDHRTPDRVPLDFGSTNVSTIHLAAYQKLLKDLSIEDHEIRMMDRAQQLVIPCEKTLRRFDVDTRGVRLAHSPVSHAVIHSEDEFTDDWGLRWKRPVGGLYFDTVNKPLAKAVTIQEISDYPWPDISSLASAEGVEETAARLYHQTEYGIVGSFGSSIYMRAQLMRGYEELFLDMAAEPEMAEALLDRILDIRLKLAEMLLDAAGSFLDVVEMADDLAGQDGPLLSLELYRRIIRPRTKILVDFIKSHSKARIMYHCCGSVVEFIEDFIDMGIDILNPVQVSARGMDSAVLKAAYGDRIVFWGGIDAQRVLPGGTVEDVRRETRKRLEEFGPGGGYVAFASHNLQADVPPENITAMFDEIRSSRNEAACGRPKEDEG